MNLFVPASIVAVCSYALLSTVYKTAQVLHTLPANVPPTSGEPAGCEPWPSVDVIIPSYNEAPRTLSDCLASIASQDYAGELKVYVVDDGSGNRDALIDVHEEYARDPRFNFIALPKNVGKRKAQIAAVRRSCGDLVLNVDSDTILAPDVITRLALKMQDQAIGAAMGQLAARALPVIDESIVM